MYFYNFIYKVLFTFNTPKKLILYNWVFEIPIYFVLNPWKEFFTLVIICYFPSVAGVVKILD